MYDLFEINIRAERVSEYIVQGFAVMVIHAWSSLTTERFLAGMNAVQAI